MCGEPMYCCEEKIKICADKFYLYMMTSASPKTPELTADSPAKIKQSSPYIMKEGNTTEYLSNIILSLGKKLSVTIYANAAISRH